MSTPKPVREFLQDPNADLDYTISWEPWLSSGETIDTHDVFLDEANSSDALLEIHDVAGTETAVTFWLKSATDEGSYIVTHRVVTSAGRTDDRSIKVDCGQR